MEFLWEKTYNSKYCNKNNNSAKRENYGLKNKHNNIKCDHSKECELFFEKKFKLEFYMLHTCVFIYTWIWIWKKVWNPAMRIFFLKILKFQRVFLIGLFRVKLSQEVMYASDNLTTQASFSLILYFSWSPHF